MKVFNKKLLTTLFVFFIIIEIISRLVIDPIYFYSINTYNEKKEKSFKTIYGNGDTQHVDFLFIGNSKIPATINPQLFSELNDGKVVINAGRGYMTPGIHYQAIKNKLKEHPGFLENSVVLFGYEGSDIYISNFEDDKLRVYEPNLKTDKPMPHLLLPHLDLTSFLSFLKYSKNSLSVKMEMTFLYFSSFYRTCQFINEKFNSLDRPLLQSEKNDLVSEGGIRNDNIDYAQQTAIIFARQQKEKIKESPPLSQEIINRSSFAKLQQIIKDNGGNLLLFDMPLHSIQKGIYNSEKAQKNKFIFETWLKSKNIPIIYNREFKYEDSDFPDTWHLSIDRRDEFTKKLYTQIKK